MRLAELLYEDDIGIRFLAPTVAVVHAKGSVRLAFQKQLPAGWRSIQTYVAVEEAASGGSLPFKTHGFA